MKDINSYKNVWIFCEQRDGEIMPSTFELLSEGRKLANELGSELHGILLGDDVGKLCHSIGGYGADKVFVFDKKTLHYYTTEAYTRIIADAVERFRPEILLFAATGIGRDLAPRCAARLHTGLCADCTHLDVDLSGYISFLRTASSLNVDELSFDSKQFDVDRNLKMTRPAFGGHLMATIVCPRFRPVMATVRPGILKANAFDEAAANRVQLVYPDCELNAEDVRTEVLEVVKNTHKEVDLSNAEVIVSVGRGIAKNVARGLELANDLAKALGGSVGASRAVVDAGWMTADHQIGQTGKAVRPKLYIALGISGAIQHKIGMQDSDCIVAVNINEQAPIFEVADYGIKGDLFAAVPVLIDLVRNSVDRVTQK